MNNEIDLNKTPDSELILHAYRKWGENCLDHLLGDFAFVIWDKSKQKLFLCQRQVWDACTLFCAKKMTPLLLATHRDVFSSIRVLTTISMRELQVDFYYLVITNS